MMKLSPLVSSFSESATLVIGARAKKLASEGRSIINFGLGEPDFKTPASISEAGYQAALHGATKYTPVAGTLSLRKAICERIEADYGVKYSPEEVIASNGGKQSIFHFFQAFLSPGDEVLIPAPYWTSFPEMVKMVGAKPVIVQPRGARLSAEDIKEKITSKTRLFILNSPSNPTGVVWSPKELESYLGVLKSHPDLWIMSDDTYYQLVYAPNEWVSAVKLDPQWRERTCIIGSLSKSYAMTGWRLGWAIGPKPLIDAMVKIQGQVTSGPSSISQAAGEAALGREHHWAAEFRQTYLKRRDCVLAALGKISGLSWQEPQGAFYLFVDFGKRLSGGSATPFCQKLLEESGVCLIPGEAFGAPTWVRLTYSLAESDIQEGCRRLQEALDRGV